jgi:hypothetical protein
MGLSRTIWLTRLETGRIGFAFLAAVTHLARRVVSFLSRGGTPPFEPFAGVRVPRPPRRGPRSSSVALAEPKEAQGLDAVGASGRTG